MVQCDCTQCKLKVLFVDNLPMNEVDMFCAQKVERTYKKGETIIRAGTHIEKFIYLKSGLVKLYREGSNQKEQIITIAKPFDFVSILSVFSDKTYKYSVSALADSVTCNIELKDVLKLIDSKGNFALSIMQKMSEISDKLILEAMAIRQRHLKGRVAYILLRFSNEIYLANEFELPLSRKEIAEYVGMTTENVIRTLSEFRTDKIIKIYGKTIEIVEKNMLEKISEFG